ncbi:hypothetical protein NAH03_23705 [Stenotrophomonas maltophilia]|nr:hypothetical protein [Stenotrophomonas maltophilia]
MSPPGSASRQRNPTRRLFRRAQAADQDIDGKDYPGE